MGRYSESESSTRGVALRASKDRLVGYVARLCKEHDVRALAGGGTVFPLHALISPRVSRTVAFIVAPTDLARLIGLLRDERWEVEGGRRVFTPLPGAITRLSHAGWPSAIHLHSVIPGFFEDPERSFEVFWSHHSSAEFHGQTVPILDKISTVMFAAHDRLPGDSSKRLADSNLDYFLDQFRSSLSPAECRALQQRVREVGGSEELRPLLEGLGLDVGETVLPSDAYARWRLGLSSVTMGDICLLAVIELPPDQRLKLIRMKVPATPRGILRAARATIAALARLRRAPQRLDAQLGRSS